VLLDTLELLKSAEDLVRKAEEVNAKSMETANKVDVSN
jgi:hypothetical protein